MLGMPGTLHSIVRPHAISHLATLPVRGRHLCGHKSPCFALEGGRESGFRSVRRDATRTDDRPVVAQSPSQRASERASKQKGSRRRQRRWWEQLAAFSKRSAPFNAYNDVPFKARCYKSKASHCWGGVCPQLVIRNKLESI